jgi:hypothetical protein
VSLGVRVDPLAFGVAKKGTVFTGALSVFGAYDTEFFEIGLGIGGALAFNMSEDRYDAMGRERRDLGGTQRGLSIGQVGRLGARDGLQLTVRNSFLLLEGEFQYGGTTASAQIPIAARAWLMVRGGGGPTGYGFGELGLRVLAFGSGDRGSFFVTPTVGGAGTVGTTVGGGEISYGGPMVGVGIEWRY